MYLKEMHSLASLSPISIYSSVGILSFSIVHFLCFFVMCGVVIFFLVLSLFLYVHLHANQQFPSVFCFLDFLFISPRSFSFHTLTFFFLVELMMYNYTYFLRDPHLTSYCFLSGSLHSSHDIIHALSSLTCVYTIF